MLHWLIPITFIERNWLSTYELITRMAEFDFDYELITRVFHSEDHSVDQNLTMWNSTKNWLAAA